MTCEEETVSAERNRETLLRYYDAYNARDLNALEHLLADDVVSNVTEELGLGQGREAFATYWQTAFDAIPDVRQEVLEVVAEGDWVAARYLGTGTHQGELLGIPASGNRVEEEVGVFARFDGRGRIAEYWVYVDNLSFLQQIGAIPEDLIG
jgi:steroid delta-isomerase-like uncharacterized protein